MSTRGIGAALAIVSTLGLGYGVIGGGWYTAETNQFMEVGLLGGQRCGPTGCARVALSRLGVDPNIGRLGVLVALVGILSGLLLLIAAGMKLATWEPKHLPRIALALSVFAACTGLAFHLLGPFSKSMTVGLPAFVFFGATALSAATATVCFGALKKQAAEGG